MRHARVYFTPCAWKEEIYPASVSPDCATPVEVFNPRLELYQELPLILQGAYYGSVSYVTLDGQLLLLTYSQRLWKWDLKRPSMSSRIGSKGAEPTQYPE